MDNSWNQANIEGTIKIGRDRAKRRMRDFHAMQIPHPPLRGTLSRRERELLTTTSPP
jgi:hypothetical protein